MAKDFNHLKPWVERMCKESGLPLFRLANRAGISRAAIYSWMSDKFRPDSDTILRFVQAVAAETGVSSEELFAEALRQYTPRVEGRAPGTRVEPKALQRRSNK